MTRRRVVALGLAGVVTAVALGASACGGDDAADRIRPGTTAPADGTAGGSGGGATSPAQAYVGLTKKAAIARAEAAGTVWRITREDDEEFPVTLDYDPERINFEIDDGRVTKATFG